VSTSQQLRPNRTRPRFHPTRTSSRPSARQTQRGIPQIEVTFDIDVDGLLSVKAKELGTGMEQSVTIQGASTLDEKEVDEMIKKAEEYSVIDQEKRKNIDLKNNAEALCYEALKQLDLVKDKISEENKTEVLKLVDDIKLNIQNENFEELNKNIEKLKNSIKEMLNLNSTNDSQSNADPMSNLNDI